MRNLIAKAVLLVDGDPLSYRFGIESDPEVAWRNLRRYVREVQVASGASEVHTYLTGQDCKKGYRYHVARIKPYQGNRTGKTFNLPSRKYLWNRMLEEGGIIDSDLEADDLLVDAARSRENAIILSPDKDLKQAPCPIWGDTDPPRPPWYYILSQVLQGDRADNVPGLLCRCGPAKARKIMDAFTSRQEALQGVLSLAEGDTLRLAEITSLVALGGSKWPDERVRTVWGDLIPEAVYQELRERCR